MKIIKEILGKGYFLLLDPVLSLLVVVCKIFEDLGCDLRYLRARSHKRIFKWFDNRGHYWEDMHDYLFDYAD